jgi:hypothetical protein
MNDPSPFPPPPTDSAYIAHLWDYPHLTIAIFGMQVQTREAYAMYEAADIPKQMDEALAKAEGLLCVRDFSEGNGGLQLQYWRSHEDLARFARQMPHTAWWKWLTSHRCRGSRSTMRFTSARPRKPSLKWAPCPWVRRLFAKHRRSPVAKAGPPYGNAGSRKQRSPSNRAYHVTAAQHSG